MDAPVWEAAKALPEPVGNCIVTMGDEDWSPIGGEVAPADWMTTKEWLARGNTLIVVTSAPGDLPRVLREDLTPWAATDNAAKSTPFLGSSSVDNRAETAAAPVKGGGAMTVESKGPRWNAPQSPATGAGASGKAPAPSERDKDPSRWQLASDARGGVLYRIPVGRGAAYFLLDDYAWTNAGLDQGDNARALADTLNRSVRGGVLAFDEYRHGHGRAESFLAFLMNLPGYSAVAWLGIIWALLYAYGRNVRLKPVEPFVQRERRTAQEYIDAVAQLYERARAAPLVVEAVARRLRQVSRSPADPPPAVGALLQDAETYIRAGERPAPPNAAIRLVRELVQLRKKIYGTRTVS